MTKEIEVEGFGAFAEALEGIYNRPAIPATTGATTGDVLTLGSDGPEWAEVPKELPDTTGASTGDVLTLGASGPEWATPSGGVSYSTTEREVGTWIDGSIVYELTIDKSSSPVTVSALQWAVFDTLPEKVNVIDGFSFTYDSTNDEIEYTTTPMLFNCDTTGKLNVFNLRSNTAMTVRVVTIRYIKPTV